MSRQQPAGGRSIGSEVAHLEEAGIMAILPPGSEPLSYSARLCRRCGEALVKQRGLFGRDSWRCGQCRPGATRSRRH